MKRSRAGGKGFFKGIGHFFTHWSVKKVVGLVAVGALGAGAVVFVPKWLGANDATDAMARSSTRTVMLQKNNLTESVTVTGSVKSSAVANVTSSANYKITEVLVNEGDSVIEGQVLCVLDTTELQKEITKAQKNLTDGIATAQRNYTDAIESRDEAHEKALKGEVTMTDANNALNNNTNAFHTAQGLVRGQQQLYDTAFRADQNAGTNVNNSDFLQKQAALQTAQANEANAKTTADAALAVLTGAAADDVNRPLYQTASDNAAYAYTLAKGAVTTAQSELNTSAATYQAALTSKDATAAALASATAALNTAKQNCNYNAIEANYNAAVAAQKAARQNLDQLESTYKASLKTAVSAEEALKKSKTSDALETLQKQLKECTITATASGTITSVSATVGSLASGNATSGPLFAIQDTANLKVGVTIDEYDVQNIQVGQKVIILSDATGEKEISGSVTQISQTATTVQSTTGFGAEITVNDTSSGLLIGMSAKAKIIVNEKVGVYSVPYDAVGTDETGALVVYAKQADGSFAPVPVSVGMETDYYVEITGSGLSEGMEIRASADESSVNDTTMGMDGAQMGGEMHSVGNVSMVAAPAPAPAMGGGGR